MSKKVFLLILFFSFFRFTWAQDLKTHWVDSVFNSLSTSEKVAQLFMIPVAPSSSASDWQHIDDNLNHKPGGIIITGGGPYGTARLINKLQQKSEVPLLVAVAGEWGLSQTLDSVMRFQQAMVLSAVRDDSLIVKFGEEVAREMKILGIHLNFSINADIHINKQSYPTTLRYFGNSPERVAQKTTLFLRGLHRGGALAAAIHPAGGILNFTQVKDSSFQVSYSMIDSLGMRPYRQVSNEGVDGILTSYLHNQKTIGTSTSGNELFTSEIIRRDLDFKKLTFTELGFLQSITREKREGDMERLALEVGNDMIINPKHIAAAIRRISRAVRSNSQLAWRLNDAVRKILEAKYNAGLSKSKLINTENLMRKLHTPEAQVLRHQISESAVTLLSNHNEAIPVLHLENKKFLSISIGKEQKNEFTKYLSKYAWFEHRAIQLPEHFISIESEIRSADIIVVGIFPYASSMIKETVAFIETHCRNKEVIVVHFGNPQDLSYFQNQPSLLAGYTDAFQIPKIAAQIIFGGLPAQGELPIEIDPFKEGDGGFSKPLNRLAYSLPEQVGMDSHTLLKIEEIAREAIEIGATPGSHVLVAKDGKIIYEKSFGWHTYENQQPVTDETIYDLASVTKVSATLQTIMFMHERGLIDINKKIAVYLPELKDSNKKDFTIKDILTHQAGLWPFIPFWSQTVKNGELLPEYYSSISTKDYPLPVADGLFAHKSMKDSLWSWIIKARIGNKAERTPYEYRYSDMGFYMLQHLAEKILNQPMEDFLEQNLYEPLGANSLGYLPLNKFPASRIAPTEDDKLFRKRLLVGYVHDQGAAMHGGIAGHAGLFGTANDLAKLGQMLLQNGSYGNYQYYKPETVALFTAKQYAPSRRGLGWDKPTPSDWNGPTTLFASAKTFGHTGFTGTCIWVDPEFNLVFIFLSNRVYPDMTNNRLINANIRPRIQEVVYKSIFNFRQY